MAEVATSMTEVLSNVERSLGDDPNVAKFAPSKYRGGDTAEAIQTDARKALHEYERHVKRLADWCQQEKQINDEALRRVG